MKQKLSKIPIILLLPTLLMMLVRFVFFFENYEYFELLSFATKVHTFWLGFRFDLFMVLFVNSLFLLIFWLLPYRISFTNPMRFVLKTWYVITNSLMIFINFIDVFYYPYTFKRLNTSFFDYLETQKNMDSLNVQFIEEYWYGFIIFIFSIYFLIKFFPDFRAYVISKTPLKSALSQIFVWTLVILTFTSNRYNVFNGFLKPSEAVVDGIENPHQVALAINTPYNFLWDYKQPVENPTLAIHYPEPKRTVDSSSTNKNVLLIVLESFASEATQKLNPYTEKSYTPFLDSLFQKGFLFENAFSNGRQSMDAIPAIWNSIPALEVPFILASKKFEKISGLPSVMKANGYHTSYFHAAQNGSMDFDRYAKQNSIDAYYGMKEYPTPKKDFDGTWGIWDEPYLQFVAKELETLNKPFFSTVFTLSSHNPCKIPNKYESSFEGGELAIYKAIEYSDMALRKFFETAKKQSWYQNTLFVIVADHSIHPLRKEFKTAERGFSIPIFFYEPGNESLKGNSKRLAQQLDIFPTILGELGIPKPKNILGNDLFDSQSKEMVINYYNGVYQIQNNNTTRYYTVQSIDGKESTKIPFDQEVSKILGMNLKPIMN